MFQCGISLSIRLVSSRPWLLQNIMPHLATVADTLYLLGPCPRGNALQVRAM